MSDDCRKCCDMVKAADQCPHARAIEVENVECDHCGIHGQLADVIGAAHGECVGKFVDHEFVADRIADAVLSSGLVAPAGEVAEADALAERVGQSLVDTVWQRDEARRERDAALAAVKRVREAMSNHPDPCEKHPEDEDGDTFCGWKSAYGSVTSALDTTPRA